MTICFVIFLAILSIVQSENSISQIYFDPTTSMTNERRDGVVVLESRNGEKSTICNENFSNEDATVICRMMGYSDGENAFVLISSKSSDKNLPIFFSNFSCQGNESTVEQCPTFQYKLADPKCQSHENDVHVFCNSPRIVSREYSVDSKIGCDPNVAEITHGTDKSGLMILKAGNRTFTLCGINNNFGENEARLFCKLLCFNNVNFARIISNYEVKGSPIGGFRNMKCLPNVNTINECTDVLPDDSEMCTPADNIGVACESQSLAPEPKPKIECKGDSMILHWDKKIFPDVNHENVNILENGANCTKVFKNASDLSVILKLKIDQCNPSVSANKDSIIFRHKVQRVFHKVRNIVGRNNQNFEAVCFIARKEIVGDNNINLQAINISPAGGSVTLETKLELSTSFDFSTLLSMPYSLKIGTRIYGIITLLHAPGQLRLVLQRCYIYNNENESVDLIRDRCAVRDQVKINPIKDNIIKFNFRSFAIGQENAALSIRCETSKCGKAEIGCIASCQKA